MKKVYKESLKKIFVSLFAFLYTFLPYGFAIADVVNEFQGDNAAPMEIVEEEVVEEQLPEEEEIEQEEPTINPEGEKLLKEAMSYPVWNVHGDTAITYENVELGKVYVAPQDSRVKLIFTKLPEVTSKLTIEKIILTQEEIDVTGAISEVAYDITTDMENGTFEYDLELPSSKDNVKIVYVEEREDIFTNLQEVDNEIIKKKDTVKIRKVDHFTIVIVTTPGPTFKTTMVNGMPYVTVPPSTSVTVTVTVKLTGGDWWRSTEYKIGSGSWQCANTDDHSSGTHTESFVVSAPATVGSYNLSLKAYANEGCGGTASDEVVFNDVIRVATTPPSLTPPTLTSNPSDPVALTSVTGKWTLITGGSGHQGVNTNEIRWGTPTGSQKSGLRFTNSGNQSFKTGDTFYLGMLTHMNWPTQSGTAANGAKLQITLNFDRPNIPDVVLNYNFAIEETPNTSGSCKVYQRTLTPCDDKVTFPNPYAEETFTIGDTLYTLVIKGFVDDYPKGNPVDAFVTEEQKDNSAFLVGYLSSILVEKPEIRLTKKTNDKDISSAPGDELYVGDMVTWKYIIQNSGNVELTNVTISDNPAVDIDCDPDTDGNQNSGFTIPAGGTLTCTASGIVTEGQYHNVATVTGTPPTGSDVTAQDESWYYGVNRGSIKIVKNALGGDGTFTFTSNFGVSSLTTTEGTASQTITGVTPGSNYSISETVPSGWVLDSAVCDKGTINNILVEKNSVTTCTFTNSKIPTLTVTKFISPADDPGLFNLIISGGEVGTNVGHNYTTTPLNVDIGYNHSVTETAGTNTDLANYTAEFGGDCDSTGHITLSAGENKNCTITNTRITKPLYVGKYEDDNMNDIQDAGEASLNGWEMQLYDNDTCSGTPLATAITDDSTGVNGRVKFDNLYQGKTYWVKEVEQPGWKITSNNCKSITIHDDIHSNNEIWFGNVNRGKITVYKFNDINGNGVKEADEPTLPNWEMIMGQVEKDSIKQTTDGSGKTLFDLPSGEYELSETIQDGWEQTGIYCEEQGAGVLITAPGEGYGCHGDCWGWNNCGDAATCALWACNFNGYQYLVSHDEGHPCTQLNACRLFNYGPGSLDWDWGNWCDVFGVSNIRCSNSLNPQDSGESQLVSNGEDVVVNPGQRLTCYIGNHQNGSIHGYKWNDTNKDGEYNEGETKLSGWEIFIDQNDNSVWDEGEPKTTTSNDPDPLHFGWYWFENLVMGTYKICEVPQLGWEQSYPVNPVCHLVTLPDSNPARHPISDNWVLGAEYNFGNYVIPPLLQIEKLNDTGGAGMHAGDTVTYTITITAPSDEREGTYLLKDVEVTDLLPNGFTYILGSWTGTSTEPVYSNNLAKWYIGDMQEGDVIVLTYKALISSTQEPGMYPDIAWTKGTSLSDTEVLGNVSTGADTPFVGTEVLVVAEYEIEEGEVLGVSTTTTLPSTGASKYITVGALILSLLGLLLIIFKPSKKIKLLLTVGIVAMGILTFVKPNIAYAEGGLSTSLNVRIAQPDTKLNKNTFNIGYVVLDTEGRDLEVKCIEETKGIYDTLNTNSGSCKVDNSVITGSGTYKFYVEVTAKGGEKEKSKTVTVEVDLSKPLPITNYSKTLGTCSYTLTFKSSTPKVQIFRSDNQKSFYANATTLITKPYLTVTPDSIATYTDSNLTDCTKTYYYAVRSIDDYNNVSPLITDEIVTTIPASTTPPTTTTTQSSTVTPVTVTPNREEGEVEIEEKGREIDEDAQVKGEEDTDKKESHMEKEDEKEADGSFWSKYKYVILAIIVAVLAGGAFTYVKREK